MTEPTKLTRRDWFRLRVPHTHRLLGDSQDDPESQTANLLKPIVHPPNHDGLKLEELPPMREALLSEEQVVALFSDVRQLATDVMLMQRSAVSKRATVSKTQSSEHLEAAKTALLTGSIKRIQIRYRWQAALWIDTLEVQADGYRLVRIAHRR